LILKNSSDDIVDSFSPLITEIEQEASAIEDSVFLTRVDELSSVLLRVHDCRKKNMNTIHFLRDKAVVIKSLARHWDEGYLETPRNKIGLFLGDVQDHVVTKMSKLEHFEDILSRSHSDYITRLSVDNIGNRTRTLKVIIRLTVVAGIVIPLNVICGLFGMNVQVPGQHVEGLGWWFGILGGIVLFVVVSLATARIKKVI
jgi:magnesium transporter